MKTNRQCVVCGVRLPSIKRSDTRYCGHTCRRRAWRTRRKGRSQELLRKRHTTLRPLLLSCWPIGFQSRRYMRPFSPPELLQRIGELGAKLEEAQQRTSDLRAQIALLEARKTLSEEERARLQAQLKGAESEVERLTAELDAASVAEEDDAEEVDADAEDSEQSTDEGSEAGDRSAKQEWADIAGDDEDDDDAVDPSAGRLELLQTQYADLHAENDRLKDKLKSRQISHDEDIDEALARAEAAEQALEAAKAHWTHQHELLTGSLTHARDEARQAEKRARENQTIATALGIAFQREQQRGKTSTKPVTQASAEALIESMRRHIGTTRPEPQTTITSLPSHRTVENRSATQAQQHSYGARPAPASQHEGRGNTDDSLRVRTLVRERTEAQQERDVAIAERDKARGERDEAISQRDEMRRQRNVARKAALDAKTEQAKAEAALGQRASKIVAALEQRKEVLVTGVGAYPFAGSYNASSDALVMDLVREIQDHENLARRQDIKSKPVTAPLLNPTLTTAQQAFAVAMAERWRLYADPPKSLKERVRWQVNGLILNAEAEALLRKRSDDRGYQSWFAAIWYEPIKARTKRRGRK
jgi:hypothetical protein